MPLRSIALVAILVSSLTAVVNAQWQTPVLLPNVSSTGSDFGPALSPDGLTLYFASNRASGFELFQATRSGPYGTFSAATQITELGSSSTEAGPSIRGDNLEIFFYSNRAGGTGSLDLWRATRATPTGTFSTPVEVTELNTTGSDSGPSITADGLTIFFATSRTGGMGGNDIWTSTRPTLAAPFATPTPVTELNSTTNDGDPQISADGLTIVFESTRPGGMGGSDVWFASRVSPSMPFSAPVNLSTNSTTSDDAPSLSSSGDELFFCSTRTGGPGSFDLYVARFTGLTANGIPKVANPVALTFADASAAGFNYFGAASFGNFGIPVDTRVIPLQPDALFSLTIGGLPPILTGYAGTLDANGVGKGQILVPSPALVGIAFYSAFVVVDGAAPSRIRTISNALLTLIQL